MSKPDVRIVVENGIAYTYVNGVPGTLNYYDTIALLATTQKLTAKDKYVETGSYLGCSALLVALHSKALVYAHDIWVTDWSEIQGSQPPPKINDYFLKFYAAVEKNKCQRRIIPIRGDSKYTLHIHQNDSISVAFIDGDHSYLGVLNDLVTILPKMKQQSTILLHDCLEGSKTLEAVLYFCQQFKLTPERIENSHGMLRILINKGAK
jgi:predicted O-methyltransferase YrrM